MTKSLSRLPLAALEIRRLQWYGLAFLAQRDLSNATDDAPEVHELAAEYETAISEAEAIEAELARREQRKRKGRAVAEPALESIEPDQSPEQPEATVIVGPWGKQLRR